MLSEPEQDSIQELHMLSKTTCLCHLNLCFLYKGWRLFCRIELVLNKAPQKARRKLSMSEARPPLSEWQHQYSGSQSASVTAGKTLTTYTHSQISGIPHVADYKDGHAGIPVMTVHTQAYMPLLPHDWSLLPTNNTLLRPAINTSTDSDKLHPHRGKHSAIYFLTSDFFPSPSDEWVALWSDHTVSEAAFSQQRLQISMRMS